MVLLRSLDSADVMNLAGHTDNGAKAIMNRIIIAAAATLLLAGCAVKTYSDPGATEVTPLNGNIYLVEGTISKPKGYPRIAETFALRRSAELALENGFTHFRVLARNERELRKYRVYGGTVTPTQDVQRREVRLTVELGSPATGDSGGGASWQNAMEVIERTSAKTERQ